VRSADGELQVEYAYGRAGELASQRFPGGHIRLEYDEAMRETARFFSDAYVERRGYNRAGRLAGIVQLAVPPAGPEQILDGEAYVYDEDGRRRYTVDEAGEVTSFRYDDVGRLARTLYPEGEGIQNAHLTQLKELGLVPPSASVSALARTGARELHGVRSLSPEDRAAIDGAVADAFPAGKVRIAYQSRVWGEAYRHDERGNRSELTTPIGSVDFEYDGANRLARAGAMTIAHDAAGNPIRAAAPGVETRYAYGASHRVTRVVRESPGGTVVEARYRYDALSRRRGWEVTSTSAGETETRRAAFSYDALTLNAALHQEWTSMDDSTAPEPKSLRRGGARSRFTHTPGSGRFRMRVEESWIVRLHGAAAAAVSGRAVTYYGVDALGSVTTLMESGRGAGPGARPGGARSSGIWDLEYRAFGGRRQGETSTSTSYGFRGRARDPVTGTYDFGFRDYAPHLARFMTQDPARAGANWYAFVDNDPMNRIDPLGLEAVEVRMDGPPPMPEPPEPERLSQQRLERDLGYQRAALCYAAAVCQGYPEITHDTAVSAMRAAQSTTTTYYVDGHAQTGVVLDPETGNVNNTNHFSQIVAREIGRDDFLYYDWRNSPDVPDPSELSTVVHDYAVETLINTETGSTHARGIRDGELYDPFEGGIEIVWPEQYTEVDRARPFTWKKLE
jgi:RHS repeat-associated protein